MGTTCAPNIDKVLFNLPPSQRIINNTKIKINLVQKPLH